MVHTKMTESENREFIKRWIFLTLLVGMAILSTFFVGFFVYDAFTTGRPLVNFRVFPQMSSNVASLICFLCAIFAQARRPFSWFIVSIVGGVFVLYLASLYFHALDFVHLIDWSLTIVGLCAAFIIVRLGLVGPFEKEIKKREGIED